MLNLVPRVISAAPKVAKHALRAAERGPRAPPNSGGHFRRPVKPLRTALTQIAAVSRGSLTRPSQAGTSWAEPAPGAARPSSATEQLENFSKSIQAWAALPTYRGPGVGRPSRLAASPAPKIRAAGAIFRPRLGRTLEPPGVQLASPPRESAATFWPKPAKPTNFEQATPSCP